MHTMIGYDEIVLVAIQNLIRTASNGFIPVPVHTEAAARNISGDDSAGQEGRTVMYPKSNAGISRPVDAREGEQTAQARWVVGVMKLNRFMVDGASGWVGKRVLQKRCMCH